MRPTRRRALAACVAAYAALCTGAAFARPGVSRLPEAPDAMHPGSSREWWRIAARLRAVDGRDLALIATFFRYTLPANAGDALDAISSLTDLATGTRIVSQRAGRGDLGDVALSSQSLSLRVDDWGIATDGGSERRPAFSLRVGDPAGTAGLTLRAVRPRIVHAAHSYFQAASTRPRTSYASFPRLDVTGWVSIAGSACDVSGVAWMDHAFGDAATARDASWDLYTLQLVDGRDLMIYVGRSRDGEVRVAGSVADVDGTVRSLPPEARARAAASSPFFWRSARSGATYPDIVRFSFPAFGLDFSVSPVVADQEVVEGTGGFTYWDGAVDVVDFASGGSSIGSGFAQLTGYRPVPSAGRVP